MKIGVVAHRDRREDAWRLFRDVRADFISEDDGNLGARTNHLKVWTQLLDMSDEDEWCVVLEDDAQICSHFMTQLSNVIAWHPAEVGVISLYMGQTHPRQWQDRMRQAVALADSRHACWITSSLCIHAVGVAMTHEDLDEFLHHVRTIKGHPRPIDETISAWCRLTKRTVGYSHPSIVNHADGQTLIRHPDGVQRQKGRVAWRFGGRQKWSHIAVPLDPNTR